MQLHFSKEEIMESSQNSMLKYSLKKKDKN